MDLKGYNRNSEFSEIGNNIIISYQDLISKQERDKDVFNLISRFKNGHIINRYKKASYSYIAQNQMLVIKLLLPLK